MPGVGLLKAGTEAMTRFRASYVAAPPPARRDPGAIARGPQGPAVPVRVLPFTLAPQHAPSVPEPVAAPAVPIAERAGDARWGDTSELDIAVARMRGRGMPAHQVWLPPLDVPDTFDTLMPDLAVDPRLGLVSRRWREAGPLRVPLGTVDVPLEQRRETLVLDLAGAGGHVAVIGGPLSGKSTALRSLVVSLSLTHTPAEVQFFVLDFGGGTFAPFDSAAHVASVATRDRGEVGAQLRQRPVVERAAQVVGAIGDDVGPAHAQEEGVEFRRRRRRGAGGAHGRDEVLPGAFEVAAGLGRLRHGNAELRQQLVVGRCQPQPREQAVELGARGFLGVAGGGDADRGGGRGVAHGGRGRRRRQRSVMRISPASVWMSTTRQSAHIFSRSAARPAKAGWPASLPIIASIACSVPKGLPQRMQR